MAAIRPLAMVVLELLHEAPMHPYEIQQKIRHRQLGRLTKVTVGSLYHAVEKLEKDELIEVVETSREGRRPERTTYRLTAAGLDVFQEEVLGSLSELTPEYPRFAMALQHLHTQRREKAIAELRRRVHVLKKKLALVDAAIADLELQEVEPMFWLDYTYGRTMRQAELDWVERLIDRLVNDELTWPEAVVRRIDELEEDRR